MDAYSALLIDMISFYFSSSNAIIIDEIESRVLTCTMCFEMSYCYGQISFMPICTYHRTWRSCVIACWRFVTRQPSLPRIIAWTPFVVVLCVLLAPGEIKMFLLQTRLANNRSLSDWLLSKMKKIFFPQILYHQYVYSGVY